MTKLGVCAMKALAVLIAGFADLTSASHDPPLPADALERRMQTLAHEISNGSQEAASLQAIVMSMSELQWEVNAKTKSALQSFSDMAVIIGSCADNGAECDHNEIVSMVQEEIVPLAGAWEKQMEVGELRDNLQKLLFKGMETGTRDVTTSPYCSTFGAMLGGTGGFVASLMASTAYGSFLILPAAFPLVMLASIGMGGLGGGFACGQSLGPEAEAKFGAFVIQMNDQFERSKQIHQSILLAEASAKSAAKLFHVRKDSNSYKMLTDKVFGPVLESAHQAKFLLPPPGGPPSKAEAKLGMREQEL